MYGCILAHVHVKLKEKARNREWGKRFGYGCETEGKDSRSVAWSIAYPIAL